MLSDSTCRAISIQRQRVGQRSPPRCRTKIDAERLGYLVSQQLGTTGRAPFPWSRAPWPRSAPPYEEHRPERRWGELKTVPAQSGSSVAAPRIVDSHMSTTRSPSTRRAVGVPLLLGAAPSPSSQANCTWCGPTSPKCARGVASCPLGEPVGKDDCPAFPDAGASCALGPTAPDSQLRGRQRSGRALWILVGVVDGLRRRRNRSAWQVDDAGLPRSNDLSEARAAVAVLSTIPHPQQTGPRQPTST